MKAQVNPSAMSELLQATRTGELVSLTAPVESPNGGVLIGYARGPDSLHCAEVSFEEFRSAASDLYARITAPRGFHGLKRIWEYLDERKWWTDQGRANHFNLHNIIDTRLLAYLLDPDSSSEANFGDYSIQEKLTVAQVAHRYLGYEYPYRVTDILKAPSAGLMAELLAIDAGLIFQLAEKLPSLMAPDLIRLYRHIELPHAGS